MKLRLSKTVLGMILFFLFMCLLGCHKYPVGYRIYPGDPLPLNEVAFLVIDGFNGNVLYEFKEEGKHAIKLGEGERNGVELLPGRYTLLVGYRNSNGSRFVRPIYVELNAQPGHLYYIKCELTDEYIPLTPTKWKPIIVDIYRDEDFNKVPVKDAQYLRNWRNKYLESARYGIRQPSKTCWVPEYFSDFEVVVYCSEK